MGSEKMNYLAQINAFNVWIVENPVPAIAQALWYRLMSYCNSFFWRESFSLTNSRLVDELNITRKQLDTARNILIQNELITYKKGTAGKCGVYSMVPFPVECVPLDEQNEAKNAHGRHNLGTNLEQSRHKVGTTAGTGSALLNKQNKTKQNINKKEINKEKSCDELFSEFTNDKKTIELLNDWIEIRKANKAATTTKAIKLNLGKLEQLAKESNLSVNSYLEEIIRRGWKSFYVINMQRVFNNSASKVTKEEANYDLETYSKYSIFDPESEKYK